MKTKITHNFGSIGEAAQVIDNYLKNFYAVNDRDARLVRRIRQDLAQLLQDVDDSYREAFEEYQQCQLESGIAFADDDSAI